NGAGSAQGTGAIVRCGSPRGRAGQGLITYRVAQCSAGPDFSGKASGYQGISSALAPASSGTSPLLPRCAVFGRTGLVREGVGFAKEYLPRYLSPRLHSM